MAQDTNNTEATEYNLIGENILTGNRWHCEGPMSLADAREARKGYKRLESDYKIEYYVEPVTE